MNKARILYIIVIVLLLAGLSLLLYPTVSDMLNTRSQARVIASYSNTVTEMQDVDFDKLWQQAREHNAGIGLRANVFRLDERELENYTQALNVSGNGVLGYVDIPKIKCNLPVYHGIDESVLQVAIGHMEWSSLPTGDKDSHCVISAHSGLSSARLFTRLDELALGDVFSLRVLDKEFYYQVDQIRVVEPTDTDLLRIVEGMELCTLMTCTPIGINSHRLLVRGVRCEAPVTEAEASGDEAGSMFSEDPIPRLKLIAFLCALSFIEVIIMLFSRKPKKKEADK